MAFVVLFFGLALLALGGETLINGASKLASIFRVPNLIIGLTVVAFGTSAPELIVSIEAAIFGAPQLAIGNIVGSNIANALFVIGIPALLSQLPVDQPGLRRNAAYLAVATLVAFFVLLDGYISRLDAALLIAGTLVFLLGNAWLTQRENWATEPDEEQSDCGPPADSRFFAKWQQLEQNQPMLHSTMLTIAGAIALAIGGKMTVNGALGIADLFNITHAAIGLSIVALGTSLPEIAAGISAARQKKAEFILGNVVGSNIFNLLAIAGVTAAIAPLSAPPQLLAQDMPILIISTLALVVLIFIRRPITRLLGLFLCAAYIFYLIDVLALRMPL